MKVWTERPVEEASLFNPAFLAVLVNEAATGHDKEAGVGLPYALAYLLVPVVLHEPTRRTLPRGVTTSTAAWLRDHGSERAHVGELAVALVPNVRESLRFGLRHGALEWRSGALGAPALRRRPPNSSTVETDECRARARFCGRWFAQTGDTADVLELWGLRV